ASGSWTVAVSLVDGSHAIAAVASDAAGNTASAAARTVVIDTTPPTLVAITGFEVDSDSTIGSGVVAPGGATDDRTVVLSG
ncbi:MAG: Ig-like domain-containing protein, partial [Planctomycetes bacterium]|nr:Ig-like domain-containing protein [Planctomycetota bacterium]